MIGCAISNSLHKFRNSKQVVSFPQKVYILPSKLNFSSIRPLNSSGGKKIKKRFIAILAKRYNVKRAGGQSVSLRILYSPKKLIRFKALVRGMIIFPGVQRRRGLARRGAAWRCPGQPASSPCSLRARLYHYYYPLLVQGIFFKFLLQIRSNHQRAGAAHGRYASPAEKF